MNYLSVCSGVEAASVAWHGLGWKPVGFSEIEKFPSAVLQHHYPQVTNYGDMTKYKEWNINDTVGLLVGGTPCQSFSVAGLRKGLEDPRGNLALTYVGILDRFKPKWFIWENVPGVLSSSGGRDFGSFLGAVAECGYGFAYRVLDAQYFGVPQRRRRVFVVGCLGDWESAAKVLFESSCLSGNTPPSREKGKATAGLAENGARNDGEVLAYAPDIAPCLETTCHDYSRADGFTMMVYETHPADSRVKEMGDVCQTVTSRWGTGGGNVPLVQAAYRKSRRAQSVDDHETWVDDGVANTINLFDQGDIRTTHAIVEAYSIREDAKANNFSATPLHVTPALQALRPSVQSHHAQTFIASNMAVRRLTPVECERLQGFPDGYTNIPWNKKEESPDGQRYKAMGNSMAVPVMRWIGQRIEKVEHGLL